MKKNYIIFGITIILAGVVIFLVKNDKKSTVVKPSPVHQISLYHYFSGSLSGGINEMVGTVNQRQSEFQVSARGLDHEAFKSMIHSMLSQGNPPELFTYWAGARIQTLVDRNQLEPIDDFWQEMNFDDKFTKAITDSASTYSGKKYVLPIALHTVVFFYNTSLFETAGVNPPSNWDEFQEVCLKLKAAGIIPVALGSKERWPAQFWFDYLLLRTAGLEYRTGLMEGKTTYTAPEVKRVYKIWSQSLIDGYFNKNANNLDWAEATELVCQNKAAMTLMGTWALQLFKEEKCNVEPGVDVNFFAFPEVDSGIPKVAVGPIDGLVLTKKSSNQSFAKTVLTYFAETEPQQILSKGSGGFAPSIQVPDAFYSGFKQKIIKDVKNTPYWAFNYDLSTPPPIAEFGLNSFKELIEFPDQYESILENVQSQVKALQD